MGMLKKLIVMSLLVCVLPAKAREPHSEGMPLPWPFPWAKECPVDWENMSGTYMLTESADSEYIDLKITIIRKNGFRLVHVSRYDMKGEILSDGFTLMSENQKTIRLGLYPAMAGTPSMWAMIKLHYSDAIQKCDSGLVPILTLESTEDTTHAQVQYRLVKVDKTKK